MAADGKINVFVKLDMNGNKSHCFRMEPDAKVSELIDLIKQREGPQVEDVRLMRGPRPMKTKNNNGTDLKLSDYNCYDNVTLFTSLRLIGGAQDPNAEGPLCRRFDTKKVVKFGASLAIGKKAANGAILEYKDCPVLVGGTNSCSESNIPKAKLQCGCIFCADCMRATLDMIIKIGGGIKLSCGDTAHGDYQLDEALLYEIAALTNDEKKEKDLILSKNYVNRVDAEMHVCFNEKCKRFIHRNDGNAKVQCTVCQKYNCWFCQKEWKGNKSCDNDNCDMVKQINQVIELGQIKTINATHGKKQCWDTRFCPVKTCSAVNMHSSGCQKITCQICNTLYCHLCLGLWDKPGGCKYGGNCEPKPKRLVTTADLPQ